MSDSLLGQNGLGLILTLAGYLSGSVPYGLVLPLVLKGVDVRTIGSGNIGATNAARAGGRAMGVAVFVLDVVKAVVPILLAQATLSGPSARFWIMTTAVAAFAGHVFPAWLGFRGGKGVATGFGIFVVLAPWAALAGLATWVVAYLAVRISSVGSLAGTAVCTGGAFLTHGADSPIAWAGLAVAAMIFWRHRENIGRLLRGEEKPSRKR
jgi:glycerol-3-phosphate acyltransferase PlsY